jgi:TPR repeat protein
VVHQNNLELIMKTKLNAFLLITTLLIQPIAYAGFDEGASAYKKGNYQAALKEFKPLAEQGNVDAQFSLGMIYRNGQGVTQDYKQAIYWYKKAAEQGDADAQYILGVMYYEGQGVSQDYKQASSWYRKAAEQGDEKAQFNRGVMYSKGQGVTQDYIMSHKWFNIAGANGDAEAAKSRNIVEKLMTPQQVEKAQQLARDWVPQYGK